ncbi:MAG: NAD(P)/FAD-dependent oxidoreductase [Actinomycetota bacterium]
MAAGTATLDGDVLVVGAGHNGLICAAYLARAGLDVVLVEARDDVGGCASTVSDLGARFNICNCDHTMIRAMPVLDELDLAAHGLRYLDPDASFIGAFHDDHPPWLFFHDVEEHLEALAASMPGQVEGYRRYLADALPVAALAIEMARTHPNAGRLAGTALRLRAAGAARLLEWSKRSAEEVLTRYFDDWRMWMPAVSTGPTVWGVHPATPGTGLAAAGYATRHLIRTGRPQGGSGALTDAVRASFEAAGGIVRCGARVERLLVDDGRAVGVGLSDGTELRGQAVVAACDPKRVFVDWVGETPPAARRAVARWRRGPTPDGYESKIDGVLDALPRYRFAEGIDVDRGIDLAGPTTVVSPSPADLADAHRARQDGRVAERPTILVNVPSALDPHMMTAEGGHVLSLEVLFTPYALAGGWPASGEPARWLRLWADLAGPGTLDSVVDWRVMTPDRYEREFGMHRGHTPSYAGTPLSALLGRERELTRYRSPIAGLYLSGAATFPGAGVFGAAGRNTAAVVQADLGGPVGSRLAPLRRRVLAASGALGRRRTTATVGR